ncbi:SPOR domain-containing protein [Vibrio rumoiensis]|uniref:Cell division protein FtsN n=1 Tax=Vibrio rumoiensis 1S-45 TaxID=1188252 RepID=A0A1E5E6G3_9VIBR|nr:SPOR domain-containing protein [Vibrio rumoiensis]OEF30043.1 cell division protein FtsN [Vibrio rumoiensis 1S-45]
MANRDYVRKNPAPNKKNNNRNQRRPAPKKKPAPRAIPWKAAIIAVILLAGLISLLSMLSNDPEPTKPVVNTVPVAAKPKPKTNDALPPPPEEKWDYMETLPKREIEVQAKEVVVPKIPYIMQCGAYKSAAQAEQRKANIAFQGLNSKVIKLEGSSWYRVILGTYKFKREAVIDQHVLQRAKIEPCIIMKDTLK